MSDRLNERIANRLGRLMGAAAVRLRSLRVLLAVGVVAGLAAGVVAFSPWVPPVLESLFSTTGGQVVVVALALGVGLVALRATYRDTETNPVEAPFEDPPEEPVYAGAETVGAGLDATLGTLREEALSLSDVAYRRKRNTVRADLSTAAVDLLVDVEGIDPSTARARIEDGEWTDDPRAAALLGNVDPPLSMRVRDWLSGEGFDRRVAATVAELQRLAGMDTERDRHSHDTATGRGEARGGGVEAGNLTVTDSSHRESTACTAVDATTTERDRWTVGVLLAFLLSSLGFLTTTTTLTLAAVVPMTYAVYGFLTRPPAATVEVTRVVSDTSPLPGEPIEVTVTVENVGEHPIPEVRVIDGVPDGLPVVDGSPRGCASLRAGESTTVSYTVEALRGSHTFGSPTVWTRNVSGDVEQELTPDLAADVNCLDTVEALELGGETTPYTGRIPTDSGGQGVEFYATREYQSTDPLNQIDWNHWARTGEPRTIQFRQNRAADVVVLLDDRPGVRQAQSDWTPDAVTLGRHAAVRLAEVLLAESNAVGAATLDRRRYRRPARGRDQLRRIESVFESPEREDEDEDDADEADQPAGTVRFGPRGSEFVGGMGGDRNSESTSHAYGPLRPDGGDSARWLLKRLSPDVQILFVTPLLDDEPVALARRFEAEGHDVTVVSPDVTTPETAGGTVARIERDERESELRSTGVRIADWPTDRPLSIALERAQHRWSS